MMKKKTMTNDETMKMTENLTEENEEEKKKNWIRQ